MIKNLVKMEHAVEGKVCQLLCDHDTQIAIVKDALFKFLGYIQQLEEDIKKKQEEAKAAEATPPTPDEVK